MFRVQRNRSRPRVIVPLTEGFQRGVAKALVTAEKLARAPLRCSAVDVPRPIFEVKDEPELDARIRNREPYAVRFGLCDRGMQIWMRVLVKHAPDLIPRH